MSGEIVNLRLARKRKAREEAEAKAADNRVKFGRAKAEKSLTAATKALDGKKLEAHRREHGDDPGDD
ncbi:MAG: DUF4169 family protein [Salinarimonadaceae bacterium]|nr:MAG: DUF4169 family protein [Salinarimonadaceae bacterium]